MTTTSYMIYRITNQVNNKIYIGKHITDNVNDNYLGSGHYLARAVKKYGKENFKKEIMFIFDNEQDMNNKEKELVDLEFVLRKDTYNLVLGGNGGQIVLKEGHPKYEETKRKISSSKQGIRWWTDGVTTVTAKQSPGNNWAIGRTANNNFKWTDSRKEEKSKEYSNGKMSWWNNGRINKRAKSQPDDGWVEGRLIASMSTEFLSNKDYNRKYDYIVLKNKLTDSIVKLDNISGEFKEFCKLNKIHNIVTSKKSKEYLLEELILNPKYQGRFKKN